MNFNRALVFCLLAVLYTGCASTKVTDTHPIATGKLPRPAHIWVHDFVATPEDVPSSSALAGKHYQQGNGPTAEQIAMGRKLGAEISTELVGLIQGMGIPAKRAGRGSRPQINDIVIHGYLLAVDEGSAIERVTIGFGSGGSELKVAVEGFRVTPQGLQKLGSGSTDSRGGKTPGAALGAVGLIATHNPVGLIVGTGVKLYGEHTGSSTVEGRAKDTAEKISEVLNTRFRQQGWIS